jgi:hypothetical protein
MSVPDHISGHIGALSRAAAAGPLSRVTPLATIGRPICLRLPICPIPTAPEERIQREASRAGISVDDSGPSGALALGASTPLPPKAAAGHQLWRPNPSFAGPLAPPGPRDGLFEAEERHRLASSRTP